MRKEDLLTLKAVILYILTRADEEKKDVFNIVKTAYYAQKIHLVKYASILFNDDIYALQFGPVPSTIYDILKISRKDKQTKNRYKENALILEIANSIYSKNGYFYAKEQPNMDYLSVSNIECLNEAIEEISKMTFNETSGLTHGKEWKRAFHSPISNKMDILAIAKENGAEPAIVEYIKESIEWDKEFCY
jgi:uncharacterized phage-associated protein